MSRWAIGLLVVFVATILGCGGGGGGVSSRTVNIQGNVIWIETGSAPSPRATVRIGDQSVLSDAVDGYFSLDTASGTLALTVTYTPTSGPPVVRTFDLGAIAADTDVGDLYIGPEEVVVSGQVLDSTDSSPVSGAKVSIGGRSAFSGSDGRFAVPGVAYSANTLTVFLGLQGKVERSSYFSTFFSPPGAPVSGIVDVGPISIVPTGSTAPPPLPYNVNGTVVSGPGADVQVLSGTTVIRHVTADGLGKFTLWMPAGTYTVNATLGSLSGTGTLTISNVNSITNVQITLN